MQTPEWIHETAVLLIDVQKNFFSQTTIPSLFPSLKDNIINLLQLARDNHIEVIHVRAHYNPQDSAWEDWYHTLHPEKPRIFEPTPEDFTEAKAGEKVIVKHTFDAFLNTDLEQYLREKKIKNLICAGVVTNCCVLFSVTGATLRGFRTFVVEDCCGDWDVERHTNVLKVHRFFHLVKLDNVMPECNRLFKQ